MHWLKAQECSFVISGTGSLKDGRKDPGFCSDQCGEIFDGEDGVGRFEKFLCLIDSTVLPAS
jgi:hypothetical protein